MINPFKLAYLKKLENNFFKVSTTLNEYILTISFNSANIKINKDELELLQQNFYIVNLEIDVHFLIITLTDKK